MPERLSGYDNVKFVLISFVVIGHIAEHFVEQSQMMKSIFMFIYFFHMPAFIFISGLFQKKYEKGTFNLNKCIAFILLGYSYKVLKCIYTYCFEGKVSFYVLAEDGIPWFLFVLAMCMGIMYLCRNLKPAYLLIVAVLIACFSGYDQNMNSDFLCLRRFLSFFPFFAAGYYLEPKSIYNICQKGIVKIVSIALILVLISVCIVHIEIVYELRHLVTGRNPFNEWDSLHGGGISLRLLCYFIAALMCMCVISVCPNVKLPICTRCGEQSLRVYFWHKIIVEALTCYGVAGALFSIGVIGKLFLLIGGVLIAIFTSTKIFAFPTDYILKKSFIREKYV